VQQAGDPMTAPRNIQVQDSSFLEEIKKSNLQELQELLDDAIREENYEKASLIRDELKRRKKE